MAEPKHQTIRVGQDEVRCTRCKRQWGADEDAPETCKEARDDSEQKPGSKPKALLRKNPPVSRTLEGRRPNTCLPTPMDRFMGRTNKSN